MSLVKQSENVPFHKEKGLNAYEKTTGMGKLQIFFQHRVKREKFMRFKKILGNG